MLLLNNVIVWIGVHILRWNKDKKVRNKAAPCLSQETNSVTVYTGMDGLYTSMTMIETVSCETSSSSSSSRL
jgi:hypothetical protein